MPTASIVAAAAYRQMLSSTAVDAAAASSVSACAGRPSAAAPQPSASLHPACWPPPPQAQQLLGEFEWVAAGGESTKPLRRSFRDVLADGLAFNSKADCCGCDSWLTAAAPPAPLLRRDASISSTPTAALSDAEKEDDDTSSRCSSSSTFSFSSGDCSAEWAEDDWPLSSSTADTAAATNPPAQPLDLSSHCGEVDWDAWAAEEEQAAAAAAEAAAAAHSRLYSANSTDLGDVAYDSRVGRVVAAVCLHSGERLISVRTRHRHSLSMFAQSRPYSWNSRSFSSHSDLHYWRPSTKDGLNIARLQQGAKAGVNQRINGRPIPAPKSATLQPRAPVSNPFENASSKQKDRPKRQPRQNETSKQRSNGKSNGAHKQARASTHAARHSLAAPTRPAMESASAGHCLVLQQRAARKTQLAQIAAHPTRMPKHMRPHSHSKRNPAGGPLPKASIAVASTPADPSKLSRADVTTRYCTNFDSFRRAFYLKHRAAMESALEGCGRRVVDIRFAPVASHARSRFMKRLQSLRPRSESEVPLVYHGTHVDNMDSILRRGLLVPHTPASGVRVANGSSYGVGIYTCKQASYSAGYTFGTTSTLFVCAALTTGARSYSYASQTSGAAVVVNDVVVLMDEARVCPLFLLDFEDVAQSRSSLKERGQGPWAPTALLRTMLRRMHTKSRAVGASNAHTVMSSVEQQQWQLQD